jgi:hypothetical protein
MAIRSEAIAFLRSAACRAEGSRGVGRGQSSVRAVQANDQEHCNRDKDRDKNMKQGAACHLPVTML